MKKRLVFGTIGCGLLIGATIYWVIKSVNKDSVNKTNEVLLIEEESIDFSPKHISEDKVVDLDAIKLQSANSIYNRHKEATQVVKESMEKINENTDLPSEHEDVFDSMFKELDMLSDER